MTELLWAGLLAVALAGVNLAAGTVHVRGAVPRRAWLSAAGGVSVAYVFVHLLPELAARQALVPEMSETAPLATIVASERLLFVAALAGFTLFYGVERAVRCAPTPAEGHTVIGRFACRTSRGAFWLHVGTFAVYYGVVGYLLLHRAERTTGALVLYATAMGLHFLVNDYGLYDHHREAFATVGRWILAAAVLAGFTVGYLTQLPQFHVSLLIAFLAGGIVLNVIKEELPEDEAARFWAFGAGVTVYSLVLLLV